MKRKNAFTLVEVLAVIVILSAVLLIVIPSVTNITDSSKVKLRNAKIKTIETAAQKYGNELINDFQNCLGNAGLDTYKKSCVVEIETLINKNYMDGDNKTESIIDPTTNSPLTGKVLLCYNNNKISISAKYVEKDEDYTCASVSESGGNSLDLKYGAGKLYVNGDEKEVLILSSGKFDSSGFKCSSSNSNLATCRISGNTLIIIPTKTYPKEITDDTEESEHETVEITVSGKPNGETNSISTIYTASIYPTSMTIEDDPNNRCMEINESSEAGIKGLNIGTINVTSNDSEIIEGYAEGKVLSINAKDKPGMGTLTIEEQNGKTTTTIEKQVYKLETSEMPESLIKGDTKTITITSNNTWNTENNNYKITVTTSNANVLAFKNAKGENVDTLTFTENANVDNANNITLVATGVGTTEITISGAGCGVITKTIEVDNIQLGDSEAEIYINGASFSTKIDTDSDYSKLTCTSSDKQIASCDITGDVLTVIPSKTAPSDKKTEHDVKITVSDGRGTVILNVKVYTTSLNFNSTKVCSNINDLGKSTTLNVTGTNMGTFSQEEITTAEWYLVEDSAITKTNEGYNVSLATRFVNVADPPYNIGYNTGKATINFVESNGNQKVSVEYYSYSLSLSKTTDDSLDGLMTVGGTKTFKVLSSATGPIKVTSSNPSAATVSISSISNYNYEANSVNEYTVTVTGKSVGSSTITISGEQCGSTNYAVTVSGKSYTATFKKGGAASISTNASNCTGDGSTVTCSCTTTGSSSSCSVPFPTIKVDGEYSASGWRDTSNRTYPTSQATIDISSDKTFIANVADTVSPSCTFADIPDEIPVGKSGSITLNCTDKGSGLATNQKLTTSNFTISSDLVEITSISNPTAITNGYSYTINVQGTEYKEGTANITLKSGSIKDNSGNTNESITSSALKTLEYTPYLMWEIGKVNRSDVVAVLYTDSDYQNLDVLSFTLKIYGSGEMLDFTYSTDTGGGWSYAPWTNFRFLISQVIIEDRITNIGDYAFYSIQGYFTKINLPNSITTIGDYAFQQSGIIDVVIPSSVEYIGECAFDMSNIYGTSNSVKTLTFEPGSKLKTIGDGAFAGNHLKSVTIPASVETIGQSAFSNASNETITSLTFESGSSLKSIGAYAFMGHKLNSLTIPASVESIGMEAFLQDDNVSTLEEISFESGSKLKTIERGVFSHNKAKSITIPASVTKIESYAFSQSVTQALTSLTFESDNTLTYIGYNAFEGNILSSLTLPNSVTTVEDFAFGSTSKITNLYIGPNLTEIGNAIVTGPNFMGYTVSSSNPNYTASDGVLYNKSMNTIVDFPEAYGKSNSSFTVPSYVTTINKYAFYGCIVTGSDNTFTLILTPSTTSLNLNLNFYCISINKFSISGSSSYYSSLDGLLYSANEKILYVIPSMYTSSTYTIPSSVNTISSFAAAYESNMSEITIPSSVTSVGAYAFYSNPLSGGIGTINLYSSSSLNYEDTSFQISHYGMSEYRYISREINVTDSTLKSKLETSYPSSYSSEYTINYVGS